MNTALGRSLAEAQGVSADLVNCDAFGNAAVKALKKGKQPPSAKEFLLPPPSPPIDLSKLGDSLGEAGRLAVQRAEWQEFQATEARRQRIAVPQKIAPPTPKLGRFNAEVTGYGWTKSKSSPKSSHGTPLPLVAPYVRAPWRFWSADGLPPGSEI